MADETDTNVPETPILDALRNQGYEFDEGVSDEQVLAQLEEAAKRANELPTEDEYERLRKLAAIGEKTAPYLDKLEKLGDTVDPGEKVEPEKSEFEWKAPEVDPSWYSYAKRSDDGRWVGREPEMENFARRLNEYEDNVAKINKDFLNNPYDFTWRGLEGRVGETVKPLMDRIETLEQALAERDSQQFKGEIDAYYADPENGLFVGDTNDLTPKGKAYQSAFQQAGSLLGAGEEPSPEQALKMHRFAVDQIKGREFKTEEKKKKTFLERAKESGTDRNRGKSIASAAARADAQTNQTQSWDEIIQASEAELG